MEITGGVTITGGMAVTVGGQYVSNVQSASFSTGGGLSWNHGAGAPGNDEFTFETWFKLDPGWVVPTSNPYYRDTYYAAILDCVPNDFQTGYTRISNFSWCIAVSIFSSTNITVWTPGSIMVPRSSYTVPTLNGGVWYNLVVSRSIWYYTTNTPFTPYPFPSQTSSGYRSYALWLNGQLIGVATSNGQQTITDYSHSLGGLATGNSGASGPRYILPGRIGSTRWSNYARYPVFVGTNSSFTTPSTIPVPIQPYQMDSRTQFLFNPTSTDYRDTVSNEAAYVYSSVPCINDSPFT